MNIPIADIKINPDRHRKTFTNIEQLARSIKEFGQIEPIVVDENNILIAGERRLRAFQLLAHQHGFTHINATRFNDLGDNDYLRQSIELEENLQREQLIYSEEVEAKLRIHELKEQRYGPKVKGSKYGWGIKDTAELLDVAAENLTYELDLAREIRKDPTLAEKPNKSTAIKAVKARRETEIRSVVAQLIAEDEAKRAGVTTEELQLRLLNGNSLELLGTFLDETFDFCITDPPWGVGFDNSTLNVESHGETNVESSMEEVEQVFTKLSQKLKPGAHLYVFFGMLRYQETFDMLSRSGFNVHRIPLIWLKGRSGNINPNYNFTSSYETIFYATKGSGRPLLIPGREDILIYERPPKRVHPTQKPVELLTELIKCCSLENEIGIDPFAGSGSLLSACKLTNRRGVGIERDPLYYTEALSSLNLNGG